MQSTNFMVTLLNKLKNTKIHGCYFSVFSQTDYKHQNKKWGQALQPQRIIWIKLK